MIEITPVRLAKLGFLLFVPPEIIRLLLAAPPNPWLTLVVWLGQIMVLGAAGWQAFLGPRNVYVIWALCGLLFVMAPLWPWFTMLYVEVPSVPAAMLEDGTTLSDFFAGEIDPVLIQPTWFDLLNAPLATFAASPHGCATLNARGNEMMVINDISPTVHTLIWLATIGGNLLALVGGALGAYGAFKTARSPTDRVWIVAAVLAAVLLGLLLLSNSGAWLLAGGCQAPEATLSRYQTQFWYAIILHPFGPTLMLCAVLTLLIWPGRLTRRVARADALRHALRANSERG